MQVRMFTPEQEKEFFEKTKKSELTEMGMAVVNDPLRAMGIEKEEWHQLARQKFIQTNFPFASRKASPVCMHFKIFTHWIGRKIPASFSPKLDNSSTCCPTSKSTWPTLNHMVGQTRISNSPKPKN